MNPEFSHRLRFSHDIRTPRSDPSLRLHLPCGHVIPLDPYLSSDVRSMILLASETDIPLPLWLFLQIESALDSHYDYLIESNQPPPSPPRGGLVPQGSGKNPATSRKKTQ